jgi:hypothetical protein
MFALQDGELLAEGQILQDQSAASTKNAKYGPKAEPEQVGHGGKVIADWMVGCLPMSLI